MMLFLAGMAATPVVTVLMLMALRLADGDEGEGGTEQGTFHTEKKGADGDGERGEKKSEPAEAQKTANATPDMQRQLLNLIRYDGSGRGQRKKED